MRKLFLSFLTIVTSLILAAFCEKDMVLNIDGGKIQGVRSDIKNVAVYRGIPYAEPPVGDMRWKEPQPVKPWEGIRVADKFGNAAYQAAHVDGDFYKKEFFWQGDPPFSEDCLYLNVWTPAPGKTGKKLPVAMWIHGGAYYAGWGFEPEFDGEAWAEKGIVLVTINYRLGLFGFLAHPALSAESPHHVSGNYGILDQIAALKWIVRNISQFGGDPDNITVFGQSAGAFSVQTLVTSPLSKDIPSGAIIQSGGGIGEMPLMRNAPLTEVENNGKKLMDWAGYTDLEKMRSASAVDIFNLSQKYMQEARQFVFFTPTIDKYVLFESFSDAALAGRISDIPYMIGGTKNDIGPLGGCEVIGRFCLSRQENGGKAFAYQFARSLPGDSAGAFHSSELWYVFNTLKRSWRPFENGDYELSNRMVEAWTNFARTGDPNSRKHETWLPYTKENPGFMIFNLEGGEAVAKMEQPLPSFADR
jgi:para-nitrobenzyl esterase